MGSLSFNCPLCCGETFSSSQSLKYHLLNMSDNLFCPICLKQMESLTDFIQHLEDCKQDSNFESDLNMQNNDQVENEIEPDEIDDLGELPTVEFQTVDEEEEEGESAESYSCSSCGTCFTSVLEHIKEYHDGQEVVLEVADQEGLTLNPNEDTEDKVLDEGTVIKTESCSPKQAKTLNTLKTEECVDSDGRLYTRKVVQVEKFWDKPESSSPEKMPMIEKFFSNAKGVKKSKSSSDEKTTYRCSDCHKEFTKLTDLKNHGCFNGSHQCAICELAFSSLKALNSHAKVHAEEDEGTRRVFVCSICATEFMTHKSLRLHSRMHAPVRTRHVSAPEGEDEDTFTCLECGKTLSESYRTAHMALHSEDPTVTCGICNRKFDSAESLSMHAAVHNDNTFIEQPASPAETKRLANIKPYQCQHCGRRFTRPHEKVKHERIHTGEKPHVCEVCGKTFRVSYCLTLHMRTHTGVRPYECKHCGKRFKASSVYNHHLLTHGEERAYTCPYCPKTFKTRVQLAGHKNSHTKPFRCTECSRPFASLYAARAHIATHKKDNNLKFSCIICGASYGRAFALKDHLKIHGDDVPMTLPIVDDSIPEGEYLLAEEEIQEEEMIAIEAIDEPETQEI